MALQFDSVKEKLMATEKSPTVGQVQIHASATPPRRGLSREARWVIIGVLLIVFLALSFLGFLPQDLLERLAGTGSVVGTVVDVNGKPTAANVLVVKTDLETQTDAQGYFELRGVPAGDHLVVVALTVSGVEYRVQVTAGQVVDMGQLRAPTEDKGR
jgi:hypothetical protein